MTPCGTTGKPTASTDLLRRPRLRGLRRTLGDDDRQPVIGHVGPLPWAGSMFGMTSDLGSYRGEFRFVFYTLPGRYEQTVDFYGQVLEFTVVGGFPSSAYSGERAQ